MYRMPTVRRPSDQVPGNVRPLVRVILVVAYIMVSKLQSGSRTARGAGGTRTQVVVVVLRIADGNQEGNRLDDGCAAC